MSIQKIIIDILNGNHFHNVEGTLGNDVKGGLAAKVTKVSPRAVHLAKGTVFTHSPPSPLYVEYLSTIYRNLPEIICPQKPYDDYSQRLCLADRLIAEGNRDEIILRMNGNRMMPYIMSPDCYRFLKWIGQEVDIDHDKLQAIDRYLDKRLTKKDFVQAGIQTPDGVISHKPNELKDAAESELNRHGRVFLRHTRGDGGLGNVAIRAENLEDMSPVRILNFLEKKFEGRPDIPSLEAWCAGGVLVEKFYDLDATPGVLLYIGGKGTVTLIQIHGQLIDGGTDCVGVVRSPDPKILVNETLVEAMRNIATRFGKKLAKRGLKGTFLSIDFGFTTEGELLAFEVNPRMTAACVGLFQATRFGIADTHVTLSDDQLQVAQSTTLDEALAFIFAENIAWDRRKQRGVTITVEPHGSMGYTAHAPTLEEVKELQCKMNVFSANTFSN